MDKKDRTVLFIVSYLAPFLFWYQFKDSIRDDFNFIVFIVIFTFMLISPVAVLFLKEKKKEVF